MSSPIPQRGSERLSDILKIILDLKSDSKAHELSTLPCSQDPALEDLTALQGR